MIENNQSNPGIVERGPISIWPRFTKHSELDRRESLLLGPINSHIASDTMCFPRRTGPAVQVEAPGCGRWWSGSGGWRGV